MSFLDFKAKNLTADLASGAVSALVAIPDAIASAFLAGVNPTYAFNALMTGTPIGALTAPHTAQNVAHAAAQPITGRDSDRQRCRQSSTR